jgi:hypothetical protein
MTVWPGGVISVPLVTVHDEVSLEDEWVVARELAFWEPGFPGWRDVVLPREFYLRELEDVDIGDPHALLEFTRAYGLLPTGEWRDLPYLAHKVLAGDFAYPHLDEEPLPTVPLAQAIRAEMERRWAPMVFHPNELGQRNFFHLDEIRMYIEAVRDMVQLWQVVRGDLEPGDVRITSRANTLFRVIRGVDDAAQILGAYLNAGLSRFSVHVAYASEYGSAESAPCPVARTYHACCLQLANHIAERAPYRRCPACGRLFVRKVDDRYQKGQNRVYGGVIYCSSTCTNRAAKDAQRRRRSAGKGERGSE